MVCKMDQMTCSSSSHRDSRNQLKPQFREQLLKPIYKPSTTFPYFETKSARLLQWLISLLFATPQSSHCMYQFLAERLISLVRIQRSQVRVLASARNVFVHVLNRIRLKGPRFIFFGCVRLVSEKLNLQKALLSFFLYFATNRIFIFSLFYIFRYCEIFQNDYFSS